MPTIKKKLQREIAREDKRLERAVVLVHQQGFSDADAGAALQREFDGLDKGLALRCVRWATTLPADRLAAMLPDGVASVRTRKDAAAAALNEHGPSLAAACALMRSDEGRGMTLSEANDAISASVSTRGRIAKPTSRAPIGMPGGFCSGTPLCRCDFCGAFAVLCREVAAIQAEHPALTRDQALIVSGRRKRGEPTLTLKDLEPPSWLNEPIGDRR